MKENFNGKNFGEWILLQNWPKKLLLSLMVKPSKFKKHVKLLE